MANGSGARGMVGKTAPVGPHPARRLTAGERRQQLFDTALTLFAERGYRSTTMDDVAEAAGVTKPLVYQHFSSKRALYLELVDSVARDMLAAIASAAAADSPRQQVERGFAAYFELVVTHQKAFRLLYGRNDAGDEGLDDALRRVEDAIAEAIEQLITAGLDPEHRRFLAYAVVGMAEGASRHWIATRTASDAPEAIGLRPGSGGPGNGGPGNGGPGAEAQRLAARLADLAWAGLRSVHSD